MLTYAKPEQKQASKDAVQKKESEKVVSAPNLTGIPDTTKTRFENLSGFSFDDVRVHYNSDKPAQLQALAYTRGNEVYIAPGQEKHLGHELGHVVQQKEGRVKPTANIGKLKINSDAILEKEADNIFAKASIGSVSYTRGNKAYSDNPTIQRKIKLGEEVFSDTEELIGYIESTATSEEMGIFAITMLLKRNSQLLRAAEKLLRDEAEHNPNNDYGELAKMLNDADDSEPETPPAPEPEAEAEVEAPPAPEPAQLPKTPAKPAAVPPSTAKRAKEKRLEPKPPSPVAKKPSVGAGNAKAPPKTVEMLAVERRKKEYLRIQSALAGVKEYIDARPIMLKYIKNIRYKELNEALRNPGLVTDRKTGKTRREVIFATRELRVMYETLVNAIRTFPLNEEITLWRGTDVREFPKGTIPNVDDEYVSPSFTSTSYNKGVAEEFANTRGILLEIRAVIGNFALPISGEDAKLGEEEFLLLPGTRFKVRNIERNRRVTKLVLSIVSPVAELHVDDEAPLPAGIAQAASAAPSEDSEDPPG